MANWVRAEQADNASTVTIANSTTNRLLMAFSSFSDFG
jgi:hypothetical protein